MLKFVSSFFHNVVLKYPVDESGQIFCHPKCSGEGSAQAGFLLSTFCFVAHKQKERIILYICDPKNLGSFCRTPFLQAFGSIYFPESASKFYESHLL